MQSFFPQLAKAAAKKLMVGILIHAGWYLPSKRVTILPMILLWNRAGSNDFLWFRMPDLHSSVPDEDRSRDVAP